MTKNKMVKAIYYTDYKNIFWILISLSIFILLFFPYLNIKLIDILFLQIILLICYSNIYTFNLKYIFKYLLYIVLYTLIVNFATNYKSFQQAVILIPILYIPYRSQLIFPFSNNSCGLKFNLYYICVNIPTYIKRIVELNANYLVMMQSLSILAHKEKLFKSFIRCISLNFNLIFLNLSHLSNLLSNQILENVLENMCCIYLGMRIKNQVSTMKLMSNTINSLYICLEILSDITYSYNVTLWTKSVKVKFDDRQFTITL